MHYNYSTAHVDFYPIHHSHDEYARIFPQYFLQVKAKGSNIHEMHVEREPGNEAISAVFDCQVYSEFHEWFGTYYTTLEDGMSLM